MPVWAVYYLPIYKILSTWNIWGILGAFLLSVHSQGGWNVTAWWFWLSQYFWILGRKIENPSMLLEWAPFRQILEQMKKELPHNSPHHHPSYIAGENRDTPWLFSRSLLTIMNPLLSQRAPAVNRNQATMGRDQMAPFMHAPHQFGHLPVKQVMCLQYITHPEAEILHDINKEWTMSSNHSLLYV